MDIPARQPPGSQEGHPESAVSPLSSSPLPSRHTRQDSIDSQNAPSSLRRISWHSSTHAPPSPGPERRIMQESMVARIREHQEFEEEDPDETTAILRRANGSGRNYNTQDSAAKPPPQMDGPADDQQTNDYGNAQDPNSKVKWAWWKRTLEKYGSVELENKGSVARDHLALERTFLAWLRTSLSFASIGIAVTQLFRLNTSISHDTPPAGQLRLRHAGKPLGATFIAIGITTLLVGFHRYFESQHYVILGKFPASRGSIMLVSFLSISLILASFIVIMSLSPKILES